MLTLSFIGRLVAMPLLIILPAATVLGQQTYVSRFDAFAGYTYLNSPHVGLVENGFHTQAGVRTSTWLSFGFDYSISQGDLTFTPNLLLPSIQQALAVLLAQLAAAGKLPPGYTLALPASSLTQTFAGGPQLAYRRWKQFTLFVRPSVGLVHETATAHPGDPIAAAVVAQLAPSGDKKDTVIFYGFGGGIDVLLSKHFAVRVQSDFVHDHLFGDLLKDGRNTVRFSIGPAFNLGKNIAQK